MNNILTIFFSGILLLTVAACADSKNMEPSAEVSAPKSSGISPLKGIDENGGVVKKEESKDKKILVAYFSHSGNTKNMAGQIQSLTGSDIFEIEPASPYPADYNDCTTQAKEEQLKNARPAVNGAIHNMQDYDIVFIGYPIWWGTMPMPVFTFLESYDFSGKTVIPFATHGGSGMGRSEGDIKKLLPKADIKGGMAVYGRSVRNSDKEISAWITGLGLAK